MSSIRSLRPRRQGSSATARRTATAVALAVLALGASAASASAGKNVNIVRQSGPPAGEVPKGTHYFTTIQAAVNASSKGDYVLIEPGVYDESVRVESAQSGIWIRGMNRNTVILDGRHEVANGIEIRKANNVWVENLTVRNFEFGAACPDEECGNGIWWTGGKGSGKIGAYGWYGNYLTAYDTGLQGGYGIFAQNEEGGEFENIYASGFADSGFYIGACRECAARVNKAVMEDNALGYSGSNSSGNLVIENSTFAHNLVGIAPNSENPGDAPPPLDGACDSFKNTSPTPTFSSTKIKRCEVLRNNRVEQNSNLTVPVNGSTGIAPWGVGIELPGDYAVLTEKNVVTGNPNDGVLGFEYPNPFPIEPNTIDFQVSGNRISENQFANNGYNPSPELSGLPFLGDLALLSGYAELFGGPKAESVNNCVSGNVFADATFPTNIEGTWGCQNKTTPNPGGAEAAAIYLLTLKAEAEFIRSISPPVGQPAPPPQETMPNPCEGVPKNPLCPKGNIK
ncbi:MAG TPA: hypothetical protein VKG82_03710 [Solirubrobacteraceae bacterium]|nr:hypothetical protein [Solirubrobacteraceae bacterium]